MIAIEDTPIQARGSAQIMRFAAQIWAHEPTYLADPHRLVQARDTALVVARRAINVVRRGSDGRWRYAISLMAFEETTTQEHTCPATQPKR